MFNICETYCEAYMNHVQHMWKICETNVKHMWNVRETYVRHMWNICETYVKHTWTMCETFVKHMLHINHVKHLWNIHEPCETCVKHMWNICETYVKHMWDICENYMNHVKHMWNICETYVKYMWNICDTTDCSGGVTVALRKPSTDPRFGDEIAGCLSNQTEIELSLGRDESTKKWEIVWNCETFSDFLHFWTFGFLSHLDDSAEVYWIHLNQVDLQPMSRLDFLGGLVSVWSDSMGLKPSNWMQLECLSIIISRVRFRHDMTPAQVVSSSRMLVDGGSTAVMGSIHHRVTSAQMMWSISFDFGHFLAFTAFTIHLPSPILLGVRPA